MQTPESNGANGYFYFPIPYRTKVFSIQVTYLSKEHASYPIWATPVDKTKFLDGLGSDYVAGYPDLILFNILSIGF